MTSRERGTEGMEILSDVPPAPFVPAWHEISDANHFWFQWRLRATLQLLKASAVPTAEELRVLEVGCGSGILMEQLQKATRWQIDGADVDRAALKRIGPTRGRVLLYDIADRQPALRETYDILVLYDVLEHIETTGPFLENLLYHLRPGGYLLVNVPALRWLYSRYDRTVGHHRRYDRHSLSAELRGYGASPVALRYWGFSMVPIVLLRKLLAPLWSSDNSVVERGFEPPCSLAARIFDWAMEVELKLVRRPPWGSSLLMLARKTPGWSEGRAP